MSVPERNASNTAVGVAMLRAVHQVLDQPPRELDDPIVLRLLGPGTLDRIEQQAAIYRAARPTALRAHVLLRSRFAEERLRAAVERGATQ